MQREILFRGKRLFDSVNGKAGEWIYGIPVKSGSRVLIIGNIEDYNEEYCAPSFWDPVDTKTVGQFIGLPNKKLFEGDRVKIAGKTYFIKIELGAFMLVRESKDTCMYDEFIDCWNDDCYPLCQFIWSCDSLEDAASNIEIIGNIHEEKANE